MPWAESRAKVLLLACFQLLGCGALEDEGGIEIQGKWISDSDGRIVTYEFEPSGLFFNRSEYPESVCSGKESKGEYKVSGSRVCFENVTSRSNAPSAPRTGCDESVWSDWEVKKDNCVNFKDFTDSGFTIISGSGLDTFHDTLYFRIVPET